MHSSDFTKKIINLIQDVDSNQLGIYFSLFIHLLILLTAIGLPDFFKSKQPQMPNIIPIEIINISETTSITEKNIEINNKPAEQKILKQKKFNSSENTEFKKVELQEKPELTEKIIPEIVTKKDLVIEEKIKPIKLEEKKIKPIKNIEKVETINSPKIKPKLKPKPLKQTIEKNNSDIQKIAKPQSKPKPDFSISSMLKDLRNEESNNIQKEKKDEIKTEDNISEVNEKNQESTSLSISEIDLLRQQLSSCWNAPAGAVIEKGMKVTISAKVRKNKKVIDNTVRIVDTNISKSNTFYGPITESAMRTLLNPECIPLKLPNDKYNLWKNLTITFDYSIMKGYSG